MGTGWRAAEFAVLAENPWIEVSGQKSNPPPAMALTEGRIGAQSV